MHWPETGLQNSEHSAQPCRLPSPANFAHSAPFSLPSPSTPPSPFHTKDLTRFDAVANMETPVLISGSDGDYEPVRSSREAMRVFWIETVRMWKIAGPMTFNILCQYGANSFTSIFAGHIGDVELSAVAISLNVIGTFSFGFMVSFPFFSSDSDSTSFRSCICVCSACFEDLGTGVPRLISCLSSETLLLCVF